MTFKVGDKVRFLIDGFESVGEREGTVDEVYRTASGTPWEYRVIDDDASMKLQRRLQIRPSNMIRIVAPAAPVATGFLAKEKAALDADPTRAARDAIFRRIFS